jgi:hypothetical protein
MEREEDALREPRLRIGPLCRLLLRWDTRLDSAAGDELSGFVQEHREELELLGKDTFVVASGSGIRVEDIHSQPGKFVAGDPPLDQDHGEE